MGEGFPRRRTQEASPVRTQEEEQETQRPEHSAEFLEAIRQVEQLQLGAPDRAEIIFVALGLKPATDIYVYRWNTDANKMKDILKSVHLVVKDMPIPEGFEDKLVAVVGVARDEETLQKLVDVAGHNNHREYGRLMGYPETAIDAYEGMNPRLSHDRQKEVTKGLVSPDFIFSQDHWQEEIKIRQGWDAALQQYAPEIYKELTPKGI